MAENRSRGAKEAIKAVHQSSLTSKEQRGKFRDDETPGWKVQKMAISKKLKGQRWNPSKRQIGRAHV